MTRKAPPSPPPSSPKPHRLLGSYDLSSDILSFATPSSPRSDMSHLYQDFDSELNSHLDLGLPLDLTTKKRRRKKRKEHIIFHKLTTMTSPNFDPKRLTERQQMKMLQKKEEITQDDNDLSEDILKKCSPFIMDQVDEFYAHWTQLPHEPESKRKKVKEPSKLGKALNRSERIEKSLVHLEDIRIQNESIHSNQFAPNKESVTVIVNDDFIKEPVISHNYINSDSPKQPSVVKEPHTLPKTPDLSTVIDNPVKTLEWLIASYETSSTVQKLYQYHTYTMSRQLSYLGKSSQSPYDFQYLNGSLQDLSQQFFFEMKTLLSK